MESYLFSKRCKHSVAAMLIFQKHVEGEDNSSKFFLLGLVSRIQRATTKLDNPLPKGTHR
jgi:hypothetical protein